VEGVRHAAGRGPQAVESELRGLSRSLAQLVEWQAEPAIQSNADQHAARLEPAQVRDLSHPARREEPVSDSELV
jgi:hypothetical protein